jgi:hypothetical protein
MAETDFELETSRRTRFRLLSLDFIPKPLHQLPQQGIELAHIDRLGRSTLTLLRDPGPPNHAMDSR